MLLVRFLLLCCLLGTACQAPDRKVPAKPSPAPSARPASRIRLLPLGQFRPAVVRQLADTLRTYMDGIELLPAEPLPPMAWYAPRKRYRADSLIHWMARRASRGEIWLGITEQDISTTKGKNPDSGIMGLGFHPGPAAVVSNYRLRQKGNLYKVAVHELGHTMGLPHCPDKYCYMRDAEGGDPTGQEKYFCPACRRYLHQKGWKR